MFKYVFSELCITFCDAILFNLALQKVIQSSENICLNKKCRLYVNVRREYFLDSTAEDWDGCLLTMRKVKHDLNRNDLLDQLDATIMIC